MSSKKNTKENSNPNQANKPSFKKDDFIEREWTEDTKGEYDKDGFFITPNGSFWDPDGVYFNKEGYDKHGGRYDSEGEYIPGEGWNEKNNCYESEIEDYDEFDEQENDYGNNINKMDDDDNLDDDVFESDFKFNEPNFQKFFEGMKLDDNDNIEENKDKDNKEEPKEIELVLEPVKIDGYCFRTSKEDQSLDENEKPGTKDKKGAKKK